MSGLLFFIPITEATHDYRTDLRTDTFRSTDTAVGVTSANVTLLKVLYDDDTEEISILSSISADVPAFSSYNTTSRQLNMSGLSANTTRTVYVSYDVDALESSEAIATFIGYLPLLWYSVCILFPMGAIASLFLGWR